MLKGMWPVAIFTEPDIQRFEVIRIGNGNIETAFTSTGKLEKALSMGYEVYVVSLRTTFFVHIDKWWMKLVKQGNVFTSEHPWIQLCNHLCLEHPDFKNWDDAESWIHHNTLLRSGSTFV